WHCRDRHKLGLPSRFESDACRVSPGTDGKTHWNFNESYELRFRPSTHWRGVARNAQELQAAPLQRRFTLPPRHRTDRSDHATTEENARREPPRRLSLQPLLLP